MSGLLKTISVAGGLAVGVLGLSGQAFALGGVEGDLIINEYNAVAPNKLLEQDPVGNYDPAFGTSPVNGNGGNWVELVVVGSNTTSGGKPVLDIRGWKLNWESLDGTPDETGTITFSNSSLWATVKPGTIITVRRDGVFSSDASYSPCGGTPDWVININATDTTYVAMTGVNFHTDNDGWMGEIRDSSNAVIQAWVGETENPDSVIWNGSGVNSQEVGKLEADPSAAAADDSTSNYSDGNCSSFGAPNCWDDGESVQDFTDLRANACN